MDITPEPADADTEILVVGRQGWEFDQLGKLLDQRRGKLLRVYSQEMFLAFWGTGRDPLDNPAIANRFAENHPALEYFSTVGFDWVSTFVGAGDGSFDEDLPSVGMLKHHGYSVGVNGKDREERRQALRVVFVSNLPTVVSVAYTLEFGIPRSKERLQKISNSLATFCRNEKRKARPSHLAISQWEEDLEWLKRTIYEGRFSFQWPVPPRKVGPNRSR
jgi:hypothetical protein